MRSRHPGSQQGEGRGPAAYVNEVEAARYLRLSVSFLQKSRVTGSLPGRPCPPFIKVGNAVRYSIADLDKFMSERRVKR